jgi:cytoskeletal protein RodZ
MTEWLIGIITFVLILFLIWWTRSREFRERAEYPKFRFLENLGIRSQEEPLPKKPTESQESRDEERNP